MKSITCVPVTPEEERVYGKKWWVCVDGVRLGEPLPEAYALQKMKRLKMKQLEAEHRNEGNEPKS